MLLSKFLKPPWLDCMIYFSAWPSKKISNLIFSHVKNNKWEIYISVFIYFFSFFQAIQLFLSKNLRHSKPPIYSQILSFLLEIPSLNRNEKVTCLECGREYAQKDASRHRRICGVLKCRTVIFIHIAARKLLIISRRSILIST